MKRRDFLKNTIPAVSIPVFMGGFTFKTLAQSPFLNALALSGMNNDRVLVLIQLNGGNDGLNTLIPLDQYPNLMNARSNVAIQEGRVLKLSDATGLHPSMTGLQQLYKDQKLNVVQSVGYPNQNFSHFRSTDIWLTASDSNQVLNSGWLGRYLANEYAGYPTGYPNATMPDPLAIQIGSVLSSGLQGPAVSMGMAITSASSFYQLVTGAVDVAPNTPAGHELTYIRQVNQQTQQYVTAIKTAAGKATNLSTLYPPSSDKNGLADQLKIVANLIAGGLKTKVYLVNLGGFDTHSGQVDITGTDTGAHADLLKKVSIAVTAFQDDLRLLGIEDKVAGMTFSEFGRRIKSNNSNGTDHGAAAPLFVFGTGVNPAILGTNPTIPGSVSVNDNVPMQFDFRSVYASVLKDWFEVSDAVLKDVLIQDFQILPIFKTKSGISETPSEATFSLGQNYPNPFNASTRIPFTTNGDHVQLKVFNTLGQEVRTLVDAILDKGSHEIVFEADGLADGLYYYRLQCGNYQEVKNFSLVK